MSAIIELDLPEYSHGFFKKYGYFFLGGIACASILFYVNFYLLGLLSLILSLVIVAYLNSKYTVRQVVYSDINNETALLAEIREMPFYGSYIFKKTIISWQDVEIASILPLEVRPITFFLIIRGANFSFRTQFNKNIEYSDSSARMYWCELEKILIEKSQQYGFKLELTDLLT